MTAIYFVIFTSCTLITSIILNKGFSGATTVSIINVVLGFLVIVLGVALLQLSKIDPEEVQAAVLDKRSATILRATRAGSGHESAYDVEDPGMDTVRGLGGAFGSIHRAISMRSQARRRQSTNPFGADEMAMRWRGDGEGRTGAPGAMGSGPSEHVPRYQLYDGPARVHDEPLPCVSSLLLRLDRSSLTRAPAQHGRGGQDLAALGPCVAQPRWPATSKLGDQVR